MPPLSSLASLLAGTATQGTGYTIGTSGAVVGTITNDDAATTPPSTPTALPRPTLITAVDLDGNNSPISGEGADKAFDGILHGSYTNLGGANAGIEFTYDADKGASHQNWARCRRSGPVRGTFAGPGSAERCGS